LDDAWEGRTNQGSETNPNESIGVKIFWFLKYEKDKGMTVEP
jgi:hypothetical protein